MILVLCQQLSLLRFKFQSRHQVRKEVDKESQRFQDNIVGNFTDTSHNLAHKSGDGFRVGF